MKKADSGLPTDTMRSEDIGARRESVSRLSKWLGLWDVAEVKWTLMVQGCGSALGPFAEAPKDSRVDNSKIRMSRIASQAGLLPHYDINTFAVEPCY